MSWQHSLCVAGTLYVLYLVLLCWLFKPRKPFISNAKLHEYRITPDFRVGRDVKRRGERRH